MSLTREEIFASRINRKPVMMSVPEWGGAVYIKHLTVDDQMALSENNSAAEMPVAVLLASLVDEDEQPIFQPEDRDELRKEAFVIILKVFSEAAKVNGLSNKELDEAMLAFATAPDGFNGSG